MVGGSVLLDTSVLAAWLKSWGADRWWTVDGEEWISGHIDLPCKGTDLARLIEAHGGQVQVTLPPRASIPDPITSENLEKLAQPDEDGAVFEIAWASRPRDAWLLAEERL